MSSFPRSLYASLLVAVLLLQASSWIRGIEQRVCGLVVLPLRAYATLQSPVHAGEGADAIPDEQRPVAALEKAACTLPATLARGELEPVACRVVALERGNGRLGKSLLVLDRTRSDLRGCSAFVTHGEQLIGFLAAQGAEDAPATVELLDHVPEKGSPRRIACTIELPASGGDAPETLRCLVEPAARALGQGLLRCALVEDPYRAVKVAAGRGLVRTGVAAADGAPWPGLLVGELRVRGYEHGSQVVPIGLFANPPVPARALGVVAAWRRASDPGAVADSGKRVRECLRHRVRVLELCVPPPARERWFLAAEGGLRLPRGAAVLEHGALAGTVLGSGSGYAIAVPFGEGGEWALVWVPRDPARAPVELVARAVGRVGRHAVLALSEDSRVEPLDGTLVTGPNGLDCPSGIPVGDVVEFDREERRLRVRLLADGERFEEGITLARPRTEP